MPSYILRNLDPELWGRVKARAAADSLSLRVVILKLLELYAAGTLKITAHG